MTREIKFRAWDGERLRIVGGLGWVDGELDNVLTPKYHGPVEDGVVVMQYTGLKDKNGVEIYENDVVKCKIYGIEESGLVKYSDTLAAYFLTEMGRSDTELWGCSEKEVIGNIYENPELLLND